MSNTTQVFIIGYNKTGTMTLHYFFQNNNIKSIHWDQGRIARKMKKNYKNKEPLLKDYPDYYVFSDLEDYKKLNYANEDYFKELYYQYPNSKFILNIRDVQNWIKSRNRHENSYYVIELCKLYGINKDTLNKKWITDFNTHYKCVTEFFKNKTDKLLIFDIEKDSVDKIIKFLPEYNLDKKHYTHENKTIINNFERLFKKIIKYN